MSITQMSDTTRLIPAGRPSSQLTSFQLSQNSLTIIIQLLADLGNPANCAASLRKLRNKLLGHEALKRLLVGKLEFVEKLVPFLVNDVPMDWQKEAITMLGSIGYGGRVELDCLMRNSIPTLLLDLIVKNSDSRLRELAMRALRTIYRHAGAPRELPFHPQILPTITKLLEDPNGKIREYCAVMLANCCDNNDKQTVLRNLGVIGTVIKMVPVRGLSFSSLEAALDFLASLTKDNFENSKELATFNQGDINPTTFLFDLLTKKLNPEIRIFTSVCLSNLCRCGLLLQQTGGGEVDMRVVKILIPNLVALLAEGISVRARAAEVLALLMSESERLQIVACDVEVIGKLAQMLSNPGSNEERKAALVAFAAISSFKEECRRMVIEAKILPLVVQAMESSNEAIRSAACQCTRSLSRSVKNLRTALVDAGMIKPLMRLLYDSSVMVQKTACAALCNLVLDFSPMKEAAMKEGGVNRLVELTTSVDPELRFNALWALKNLLYLADTHIKIATIEKLTNERLELLTNDPDGAVQEQALNLIRNLVCEKEQDISEVLARFGEARLIRLIEKKIASGRDDIVMHSCYVVANACTATTTAPKDAIMSSSIIIDKISALLLPGQRSELQLAALWCVINLTWTDDSGSSDRISFLRHRGVQKQLEQLLNATLTADVRDRVQTALNNFNAINTSRRS